MIRLLGGRRCPICQQVTDHIHIPPTEAPLLPPIPSLRTREDVEQVIDQLAPHHPAPARRRRRVRPDQLTLFEV